MPNVEQVNSKGLTFREWYRKTGMLYDVMFVTSRQQYLRLLQQWKDGVDPSPNLHN